MECYRVVRDKSSLDSEIEDLKRALIERSDAVKALDSKDSSQLGGIGLKGRFFEAPGLPRPPEPPMPLKPGCRLG